MEKTIIRFTENDVDGCGTNAEVLVLVHRDLAKIDDLQEEVNKIKEEWAEDGWETDEVVHEACERLYGDDYEIICADFGVEFQPLNNDFKKEKRQIL